MPYNSDENKMEIVKLTERVENHTKTFNRERDRHDALIQRVLILEKRQARMFGIVSVLGGAVALGGPWLLSLIPLQ